MHENTQTTILTVLRSDPTVSPEFIERLIELCKQPHRPGPRVTRRKVAEVLGVHPRTVERYEKAGKLRGIRMSKRRIRYDLAAVERLALEGAE